MSSQTKISDFFGARKPRKHSKRKVSDLVDPTESRVKRVAVDNGKSGSLKTDGLRDIREAFPSLPNSGNEEKQGMHSNDSEQTPERKFSGVLYFQESKRRRKQCNSDMNISTPVTEQAPFLSIKSARKRIFQNIIDESTNLMDDELTEKNGSQAMNIESFAGDKSMDKSFSNETLKLTVGEVKQRLANCSKLSELRYRLTQINDCAEKLKKFQEKTKSPQKAVIELSVPPKEKNSQIIESPKKFLSTNVTQTKIEHAFEKFASLSSKEHENGLLLPFKFRSLVEMFRCLDFVVSLLHNRNEICTFEKLKKSFEEMTRKKFDILRLDQILHVFPESYKVNYVKNTNRITSPDSHQMVISAINVGKMTPSVLLARKETFYDKLLDIVKEHHHLYLSSLDPPVLVESGFLQRWHPNFKLEEIPDIKPSQSLIPTIPSESSKKTFASCFRPNSQEENTSKLETPENNLTKIECGVLKGISSSLLLKIRAKEAKAVAREMIREPEKEKRILMLYRLPELMKIIHNFFVCDGRGAIRIEEVLQKCVQSYHTFISSVEVKEHVTLLCDLFPEWIYLLNVRKGEYLKIDKTVTIADLINRLDDMRSKMKDE